MQRRDNASMAESPASFHNLSLTAMHVHHDCCTEIAVLRGKTADVQPLADHVIAERGVRYGKLVAVPVKIEERKHGLGGDPSHRHSHLHVRNAG
jgi:CopG family nickel-responsive transcriptional regulator